MPRPRPDRPPRPRPTRSATDTLLDGRALQVLVDDSDDVGLTIIDARRQVLLETRRAGQRYPIDAGDLTDTRKGWTVEVTLDATGPGRWTATFKQLPPVAQPRTRQTALDVPDHGTGSDAALRMRLHRIARPWGEHDLEHVANVVHAELHGCAAIDVQGHPVPTNRYYELDAATGGSGRLVCRGAALNGLELHYDPDRRLRLDDDWGT